MRLAETAYDMPTGMLLHEAGRQFTMAELVRDGWQQALYQRGGWFLLLVWAERTCGVPVPSEAQPYCWISRGGGVPQVIFEPPREIQAHAWMPLFTGGVEPCGETQQESRDA